MIGKENRVHLPMIFRGAMCSEAAKTLPFCTAIQKEL